ncbi:unnamed protein product [Paramecium pentaurelia]|uniref:Uncharacterized protein n=1 Tax=Paramecium pentaurelia TaxID=43138 RepID=A0A8S1T6T6_9CILI|nr:unnamed protein product [Paramecium pentaurelia]
MMTFKKERLIINIIQNEGNQTYISSQKNKVDFFEDLYINFIKLKYVKEMVNNQASKNKQQQMTLLSQKDWFLAQSIKTKLSLIKEFKAIVENFIDQILTNIDQKEEIESKPKIDKFKLQVEILQSNNKVYFNSEIPIKFDKLDDYTQFYDTILQRNQQFISNQSYSLVIDTQQKSQNQQVEGNKLISQINREELDKSKTQLMKIK